MAPKAGEARSGVLLLGGVVGILGGLGLLAYGLAPAKDLWEAVGPAFSGGPPPEDLSQRLDAAMGDLKGRALIDAFGFLALLAGIVLVRQAFAKPKQKPVEQLVEEEVERRLAVQGPVAHGAQGLPLTVAPSSSAPAMRQEQLVTQAMQQQRAAPAPATARPTSPAPRRTHCGTCGSVLVAGGRICPAGHAQG